MKTSSLFVYFKLPPRLLLLLVFSARQSCRALARLGVKEQQNRCGRAASMCRFVVVFTSQGVSQVSPQRTCVFLQVYRSVRVIYVTRWQQNHINNVSFHLR